jgi:hypothetical protein
MAAISLKCQYITFSTTPTKNPSTVWFKSAVFLHVIVVTYILGQPVCPVFMGQAVKKGAIGCPKTSEI